MKATKNEVTAKRRRHPSAVSGKARGPRSFKCVLQLYVSGMTPRSRDAIENVERICRSVPGAVYELDVIDIYQEPALAKSEQIIATPTLVRKLPLPFRRLIGDFSSTERVLSGLDLNPRE